MASAGAGIRIFRTYIRFENMLDQPKAHRKKVRASLDEAKRSGHSVLYDDVHVFPVCEYSMTNPRLIRIAGPTEDEFLKPQSSYEVVFRNGGERYSWRFYFCIDFKTRPEPAALGVLPLSSGKLAPAIFVPTPRRLYISQKPSDGRYQRAGFDLSQLATADDLFSNPRFIAIQDERGIRTAAAVVGKNAMMSSGNAVVSLEGEIYEV